MLVLPMPVSIKVEDVMVENVITVEAEANVKKAVEIMNKNEIGCLVVVRRGKAVGIVTERDLLARVLVGGKDPGKTKVREIMSAPLVVGTSQMEIEDAVRLMFEMKVKKLPIVDGGKLVGLVTLTDLARYQPQMIELLKKIIATQIPPKRMRKVVDYYVV